VNRYSCNSENETGRQQPAFALKQLFPARAHNHGSCCRGRSLFTRSAARYVGHANESGGWLRTGGGLLGPT